MYDVERKNVSVYEVHRDLVYPLLYMQHRGIKVDTEALKQCQVDAEAELARLLKEVETLIGKPFNPGSPKQMHELFYVDFKIPPYKDRKTGANTVNLEVLDRIKVRWAGKPAGELANLISQYKQLIKMKSSYYDVKLGEDGRLRSAINPVGARSGRLSSRKDIFDEGLNIQTLPPPMKKIILADNGYLLYNQDKAQAENRIVAYFGQDANMMEAFENGIDIHSRTAGIIYGIPAHEVSRATGSSRINPLRSQRDDGKKANHALNYKEGVRTLAAVMETSMSNAQDVYNKYHNGYPGVRRYWEYVQNEITKNKFLENPFGRRYEFLERITDSNLSEALYFIPQSTVADIINRWGLLYVWRERKGLFLGMELLNQVHDSIVYQIPISLGWERHYEMCTALMNSLDQPLVARGREFAIPTDTGVGKNLKQMTELKGNFSKEQFKEVFNKVVAA